MKLTLIPAKVRSGSGLSLILLPMPEEAAVAGDREEVPFRAPPLPAGLAAATVPPVTPFPASQHRHLRTLVVLATLGDASGVDRSSLLHRHPSPTIPHVRQGRQIIPPIITLRGKPIPTTRVEVGR